jgi:aspartyl-tRNA(Asn)/glutamyl-tRNA(Gln) amidotransferase subunit A
MKIQEFVERVKSKDIDIVEHTYKILEQTKQLNDEYNHFNTISEDLAIAQAEAIAKSPNPKGSLTGVAISVKDCLCVKGVESTAGSKILKGYRPPFNATAVQNAIDEGAIIIGKTAQDAFGFGSFSVNVGLGFKIPLNPNDKERTTGGSSGGSGGFTKLADFPHMSIGESTGGSIECPASFCGVVGVCPTYGRVSRYGLMDYANSLDKIGPMAKNVEDAALLLNALHGHDKRDSTSLDIPDEDYTSYISENVKGMKIGIIKESMAEGVDEFIKDSINNSLQLLESSGAKVKEVSLPIVFKYAIPTYYLIATTEASTNLAKYCGIRYGASEEKLDSHFNEFFTKVRSSNFEAESKRRIILGTFARMAGYRDAYYLKAAKVRTKMIDDYKKAFADVDCIISPTMPFVAPRFDEISKLTPLQNFMADIMTVGPNLAGIPHMNVPCGKKQGLPIGMMVMAGHLNEAAMFKVGAVVDRLNQ